MSITELSVKRPSAVFVLLALFIGIGIFGYKSLGADLYPSINVPIITVTTGYSGAGAEEIEEDVVKPIFLRFSEPDCRDRRPASTGRTGMNMKLSSGLWMTR